MRSDATEFLHWSQRHLLKDPAITVRSVRHVAETVKDAAALTIFSDLLKGKAPKELQAKFDAVLKSTVETFDKQAPDYEFKLGGRERSASKKSGYKPKLRVGESAAKKSAKKPKKVKKAKTKNPSPELAEAS